MACCDSGKYGERLPVFHSAISTKLLCAFRDSTNFYCGKKEAGGCAKRAEDHRTRTEVAKSLLINRSGDEAYLRMSDAIGFG